MDTNAVLKLAPDLAQVVLGLEAALAEGISPTDFVVMALRKRAKVLAADVQAARDAPQTFKPWEPHSPRNAS